MNHGKDVFAQLCETLPKYEFDKCVTRYQGNYQGKGLTCWMQYLALSFGALTNRESLRATVTCLAAQHRKLSHLGSQPAVHRSPVAEANEKRSWQIYAHFAQVLLPQARRLSLPADFGLELSNTI